ncbi:molybdate ABC transporter substrate-binding protein [Alteribacter lacisalsi]|uniref:Molybdate ABC transporter substrate-binding protein n=1 Tax=Alteribacter lacisalsi TaxID=2045244 RepID=A0A2W0HYU7_9BACI|nr:molybdate ABC transporter substrate-binding protein [Alteribacter lacisalsi]PYZ98968.1 molybdate ABC transporter substrate-binding protein [Alteribacter lacisalsi]
MKKLLYLPSALFLAACGSGEPEDTAPVHVGAAADLYHAFSDIGEQFEDETGYDVTFTFGSTGQITQQIEEGAPYDIFAAAHESYIDRLIEAGHMNPETKRLYAYGVIGLMYDDDFLEGPLKAEDLTDDRISRIAIANPEHAPYGKAARETLAHWGIWDEVEDKLVLGENIRQSYQHVETGNADVGIIALALSHQSDLAFQEISLTDHEPIVQALGIPELSGNREGAEAFSEFIFSETGQEIMLKYGFLLPEE